MMTAISHFVTRRYVQLLSLVVTLSSPALARADVMDETHTLLRTNMTKAQLIFGLLGVFALFGVAYEWWFADSDSRHARKKTLNWAIGCIVFFGGVGFMQIFKRAFSATAF